MNPKDKVGARKAPLHLVPPALTIAAAEALANGAEKYGPYNWRDEDVTASAYIGAILRHLLAYQDGEECADDSGIRHLAHAAASIAILLDAEAGDTLIDDRSTGPAPLLLEAQDDAEYGPPDPEDELPIPTVNEGWYRYASWGD